MNAKAGFAVAVLLIAGLAQAEVSELRIGRQTGIIYLPFMVMEHDKLLEKHTRAAGLGDVHVSWSVLSSGPQMNEALLSGNLQFAGAGATPFIALWAETQGKVDVRGVCAMGSVPLYLNTRNPDIRTVADFSEKDRIAMPALKISPQAVMLQILAEKQWGEGQAGRLDGLGVAMSHPAGMAALLDNASAITAHFTGPPFNFQELEKPGIRQLVTSYDVFGGPITLNIVYTTGRFREENPKVYAAFIAAYEEATQAINRDKRRAAEIYVAISKDKLPVEAVQSMVSDPTVVYSSVPNNVMKYVDVMARVGTIKARPATWKDLFFPEIHGRPGS
jgi:NitT/TauT family transport system substrate-binding protein